MPAPAPAQECSQQAIQVEIRCLAPKPGEDSAVVTDGDSKRLGPPLSLALTPGEVSAVVTGGELKKVGPPFALAPTPGEVWAVVTGGDSKDDG